MRYVAYLVLPAAGFLACSLTVPADREQCTTNSDCLSFAANAVCVSRICQAAQTFDAGDGDGGDVDPAWGCVGKVKVLPEKSTEPVELKFTLYDFNRNPIVGLPLKLCRGQDAPCSAPVNDDLITGPDGSVTLPVYSGFRGFVESKPSETHSTLFPFIAYVPIINPAIPATKSDWALTAFDRGAVTGISLTLGATIDETQGQLIFTVRDCQHGLGTNVVVTTAAAAPGISKTWYLDSNASPNVDQNATSVPGVGGIFNVKPGIPEVKFFRDGVPVGTQSVVIRAGTLTYMNAIPTP